MLLFGLRCFVLCLLVIACACPASAASAKATIFFTGNSLGVYKACPTCGKAALGGLDRRAGYFEQMRSDVPRALFVSAGYEFESYIAKRKVRAEALEPLADVYGQLGYDVALAHPMEDAALRAEGQMLPKPFRVAGARPWTQVLERGGLKIGVVGFPAKGEPYGQAADELKRAVVAAAEGLRPQVDVVLGLSTWGEREELAFAREFAGAVDLLLGSGPGTGYGVKALAQGRTVWVRPPFEGRGVIRLDIASLPSPGADGTWQEGREFTFDAVSLDSSVRADTKISTIFAWY